MRHSITGDAHWWLLLAGMTSGVGSTDGQQAPPDSDGMREKRQQRFGEVLDATVALPVVTV